MSQGPVVVNFTPSFQLRKVDPHQVYEKYRAGGFSQPLTVPTTKAAPVITNLPIGSCSDQEVYAFRDKGNVLQKVATTNHEAYMRCVGGQSRPLGGIDDFTGKPFSDTESIGIPVRMDEQTIYEPTGLKKISVYYMDGCTRTFENSLSLIKRYQGQSIRYRDPVYADSETLLRQLHRQLYPNAPPLREALDPRLNPERVMTDPGVYTYRRTSSLVLAPVKIQYLKENLAPVG
jgi:hypothetical protein